MRRMAFSIFCAISLTLSACSPALNIVSSDSNTHNMSDTKNPSFLDVSNGITSQSSVQHDPVFLQNQAHRNTDDIYVQPKLSGQIPPPPVRLPKSAVNNMFTTDFALGNGQRMAVVSPSPVNYRSADGTWQPIDPRFEIKRNGFMSERNALQIRADLRHLTSTTNRHQLLILQKMLFSSFSKAIWLLVAMCINEKRTRDIYLQLISQ